MIVLKDVIFSLYSFWCETNPKTCISITGWRQPQRTRLLRKHLRSSHIQIALIKVDLILDSAIKQSLSPPSTLYQQFPGPKAGRRSEINQRKENRTNLWFTLIWCTLILIAPILCLKTDLNFPHIQACLLDIRKHLSRVTESQHPRGTSFGSIRKTFFRSAIQRKSLFSN